MNRKRKAAKLYRFVTGIVTMAAVVCTALYWIKGDFPRATYFCATLVLFALANIGAQLREIRGKIGELL